MQCYSKEGKVKRIITIPRVIDTVFHRVIRGDLLRLHGAEINYNDLLVGFAMIELATWASENARRKLGDDADFLHAYDEARRKKKQENLADENEKEENE